MSVKALRAPMRKRIELAWSERRAKEAAAQAKAVAQGMAPKYGAKPVMVGTKYIDWGPGRWLDYYPTGIPDQVLCDLGVRRIGLIDEIRERNEALEHARFVRSVKPDRAPQEKPWGAAK